MIYVDWRVKWEFKNQVDKFYSAINKKKRQTEKEDYIKSQLEIITEQKNKASNKKNANIETVKYFNMGYSIRSSEIGFNSVHNLFNDFTPFNLTFRFFIDGIVAYEFEYFLKEELQKFITDNTSYSNINTKILLHWNGNKNQLYDVLMQLKAEGLITNSYTDLAVFLKFNFDNFNNTELSTIETELRRGKRPLKARRIQLPKGNLEKV